jgi:hypothetical protein
MAAKKGSKSEGKKTRFILGRDMSEDDMIKAIKKMCDDAGVKFEPTPKLREKKKSK